MPTKEEVRDQVSQYMKLRAETDAALGRYLKAEQNPESLMKDITRLRDEAIKVMDALYGENPLFGKKVEAVARTKAVDAVKKQNAKSKDDLRMNIGHTGWVKAKELKVDPNIDGDGVIFFTVPMDIPVDSIWGPEAGALAGKKKTMWEMLRAAKGNTFLVEVSNPGVTDRQLYHSCKIRKLAKVDFASVRVVVRYKNRQSFKGRT